jgi:hypothetical protein
VARVRFVRSAGAVATVKRAARPGLEPAAAAIEGGIPGNVPVVHGGALATYRPSTRELGDGLAVEVGSSLWHLLEYGTAYSPAYRPVEQTVRGLGLRWEPH